MINDVEFLCLVCKCAYTGFLNGMRCTYPVCWWGIVAGNVINTFLIEDAFHPPASHLP